MANLRTVTSLVLVLGLMAAGSTAGAEESEQELRAFWVDAFNEGIYSQDQVDELVQAAASTNHNAIIAQVVRRGDCFCNEALPPRTDAAIDPEPFDPLAALVDAGHAEGLEVHAWVNMNTMWNLAEPHSSPDHPINAHGPDSDAPWVSVREDGEVRPPGTNNVFFEPGHPEAMAYIVDTATSIVDNYDVDGINVDYVRYPDFNLEVGTSSWGYNDVVVDRFQAASDRSDVPDADDSEWSQWRRDQVTNTVRRIYLEVFERDPTVGLSVNAITYGEGPPEQGGWESTRTYTETLQDFRGWMEEGIVDLNVAMNYKRDWEPDQAQWYRDWNDFVVDHQYERHAVIGSALYLNDIDDSVAQIREALSPSEAANEGVGWVGYSYANPDLLATEGARSGEESRDELRRAVTEPSEYDPDTLAGEAEPVFADEATVPEMTWKTEPTRGHVAGHAVTRDGDPVDSGTVHAIAQGETVASTQIDGQGWFGFVDLEPGRYRITIDADDASGPRQAWATVAAGEVSEVSLAPTSLR